MARPRPSPTATVSWWSPCPSLRRRGLPVSRSSRSVRHAVSALATRITRRTRGVKTLRPREEAPIPVAARYRDNGPRLREPTAHLESPHHLAIGREHEDGAVVHDDLHVALVVLDA